MSYIGRDIRTGAFRQLDDISSGFDGSDTTHTMQVNSPNVSVGDVNQILLSLGGVIQKPGTDFTVSGSTLTFTTAPAANTSFFAILLGSDNGGTVTPTDGSVTGDKVASTGAFTIGAGGTASSLAGIPFYRNDDSIYTHDVSGTDSTAQYNTAYGVNALDAITTSDYNVAIGYEAGSSLTTHNSDVLIGYQAGKALSTGDDGVIAIGYKAGLSLTTCSSSVFIGYQAGDGHDTEDHNMGIGRNALTGSVAGGEYNVAVGNYTLAALTSGDYNVAVGYDAGTDLTTGERNTFIGHEAGKDCIGGGQNVAIGDAAGSGALSKSDGRNVMIGRNAGQAMTSAGENILIGFEAGKSLTIGGNNVVMGYTAMEDAVVERQNVAIGNYALANHRTSSSTVNDTGNTAVGYAAGDAITTGAGNVMIGAVVDPSASNGENQIVIGGNFSGNGDNKVNFGSSLGYVWNSYTQNATWTQVSDERMKKNIEADTLGLDFINELRPVVFNWRKNAELDSTFKDSLLNKHIDKDDSTKIHGLIAQEVKAAMDKVSNTTFNGWEDTVDGQAVSREMFITPLIKAVQELSAKVKALEEA